MKVTTMDFHCEKQIVPTLDGSVSSEPRIESPIADKECSRIEIGSIVVDRARRRVEESGGEIRLTSSEFDLLWLLAANAGRVVSRDMIYTALRGLEYDGLERSVDLRVARLRKKLGETGRNPRRIKSIRSEGYLLTPD